MGSLLYEDFVGGLITKNEYSELKELYTKQIKKSNEAIAALKENAKQSMEDVVQRHQWMPEYISQSTETKLSRGLVIRTIERIDVYTKKRIAIKYRFDSELEDVKRTLDSVDFSFLKEAGQ